MKSGISELGVRCLTVYTQAEGGILGEALRPNEEGVDLKKMASLRISKHRLKPDALKAATGYMAPNLREQRLPLIELHERQLDFKPLDAGQGSLRSA